MGKGNSKRRKRQASTAASADDNDAAATRETSSSSSAPPSASGWKPLHVHLGGPSTSSSKTTGNRRRRNDGDDEHDDVSGRDDHNDDDYMVDDENDETMMRKMKHNHYDDPKLSRVADRDLHMQPGEDCAMFYGLEVLDASAYKVVGDGSSKRLLILNNSSNNIDGPTSMSSSSNTESSNKKEKKTKMDVDDAVDEISSRPTKKQKKEKKSKSNETGPSDPPATESLSTTSEKTLTVISEEDIQSTSLSWSKSTGGASLHRRLVESLCRLGFQSPTPIQAATLSASIMGRRNMVGAAPTGSGKTLAFLLPILDRILHEMDDHEKDRDGSGSGTGGVKKEKRLKALIMTPTRELATQIHKECDKLMPDQCVTLVGGIALVKQARLLETKRPPIIIGTPGRVFQMMSSGEHEHLRDLSQIQFLVLDEADRMTQEHSFPQLIKILDLVNDANPADENDDDDNEDESDDEDGRDRLIGLPGVPGEAHLTMLSDDILKKIEAQREEVDPEPNEFLDDELEDDGVDQQVEDLEEDIPEEWLDQRVHRQTFVFSATLTLPFTSTKPTTLSLKKRKKLGLQGGIAEILEKTRAMGETKVVDLSLTSSASSFGSRSNPAHQDRGIKLPPGLSVEQIKCTQRHKDSHLYAYLMTTSQGSSGPCLVFCNSIAAVRRVGATLQTLGFSVRILHAHMQQRARFKAVESLADSKSRAIVVCTDVAARGLDIPSVSTVVHYDVARSVDTFVHRSGRTARGMGEGAKGSSLSLVAPAEDKAHSKIAEAANVAFTKVMLDGRLLTAAQERTNLASKIIEATEMENKANSTNKWFTEKAKEADLDLDDDVIERESQWSEKEQHQLREAQKAKVRLAQLLAEPMKTQRYGKFLSTNSAAIQAEIEPLPKKR